MFDVAFYMPYMATILAAAGDPPGGAETQVLMLARGLAKRGWRVALISNPGPAALPREIDGVRILVQREIGGGSRSSRRIARLREIGRTLLSFDTRVLVQRSAGSLTGLIALGAQAKRSRFVYSSANVIDFDFHRLESSRWAVSLFHLGVRLAEHVVVQTAEQARLCRQRFGREPVVIKSLAEREPLRTGAPEAFLWIGRLAHYKHPEAFVSLASDLPQAEFRMVTVATGVLERRTLDELHQASEASQNLKILDARPRGQLGELIARSVAVVNTADYEGMPNIFLEGWARGVPALALSHDPDGVIEREGLGAFARGSRERFAELARSMWSERADQAELAAACQAYIAREHSIDAVVDSWERVLGLERAGG